MKPTERSLVVRIISLAIASALAGSCAGRSRSNGDRRAGSENAAGAGQGGDDTDRGGTGAAGTSRGGSAAGRGGATARGGGSGEGGAGEGGTDPSGGEAGSEGATGGAGGMGGIAAAGGMAGRPGGSGGNGGDGSPAVDDPNSGPNTMGWIGCSLGENTANGYRRMGGTRMWGAYGNGGGVVQQWTSSNSSAWQRFDQQVQTYGIPKAVWMQICIFSVGATMEEIRTLVRNTRSHAPGAYLYITGLPFYHDGNVCPLWGPDGPEFTDELAQQMAAEDPNVHYVGPLGPLDAGEYESDLCHANVMGEDKLGTQGRAIWGQP